MAGEEFLRERLRLAADVIDKLAEQQAMTDDWYAEPLGLIREAGMNPSQGSTPDGDAELAFRMAEYVRGALAIQNGPEVSEIATAPRRAWFNVEAKDGQRVRVTVDDTTLEAIGA